jgi:hypothetical protein
MGDVELAIGSGVDDLIIGQMDFNGRQVVHAVRSRVVCLDVVVRGARI